MMDAPRPTSDLMRAAVCHDLATTTYAATQYVSGDFIFNADGTRACAPDCRGCALVARIADLEAHEDDAMRERDNYESMWRMQRDRAVAAEAQVAALTSRIQELERG